MIDTKPTQGPWPMSTVGAHFDVQLGKMLNAARDTGDRKAYLGNRAVQWGRVDVSATGLVPLTRGDQMRYRLKTNDLLVCEGGEVGRAAIWRNELDECYYQKALHRLRAKAGFDPRVMMALLEYWAETHTFDTFVTQTSIAHLPRAAFLAMPLPVIPPGEQERVAAALADANRLIVVLENRIVKGTAFKLGMVQQLLTGKIRLPGFAEPWKRRRIGDFAQVTAGGTPSTSVARYWGGDVPWMSSGELHQKRVGNVIGRITVDGLRESSAQLLPAGSVLIGLAGQGKTRGTAAVSKIELSTNQSIAGILPGPEHCPRFLYYNLDSRYEELRAMSTGGSGRGGLNLTIIRSAQVFMPSVSEQEAIANVLADIDDELAVGQARLRKAKKLSHNLRRVFGWWRGRGFGSGWTCSAVVGSRAIRRRGVCSWWARRIRLSSSRRRSMRRSRGGISRTCTTSSWGMAG